MQYEFESRTCLSIVAKMEKYALVQLIMRGVSMEVQLCKFRIPYFEILTNLLIQMRKIRIELET